MTYKSKAERERERWMTLPEAVAHVRADDGCDEEAARQQIIKALADGALDPLRWEKEKDERRRPFGYTSMTVPSDRPPSGHAWLTAEICSKTGRVRDEWSEYENGKFRVLLILRKKVEQHWPIKQSGDNKEIAATEALGSHLRDNRDLRREDGLNYIKEKGFDISDRGYKNRVWPKARILAGLPERGSPGAKRKLER